MKQKQGMGKGWSESLELTDANYIYKMDKQGPTV